MPAACCGRCRWDSLDQSAAISFAWDSTAFYIGVKVIDDSHENNRCVVQGGFLGTPCRCTSPLRMSRSSGLDRAAQELRLERRLCPDRVHQRPARTVRPPPPPPQPPQLCSHTRRVPVDLCSCACTRAAPARACSSAWAGVRSVSTAGVHLAALPALPPPPPPPPLLPSGRRRTRTGSLTCTTTTSTPPLARSALTTSATPV